jgi:hypothetical protein
MWSDGGPAQPSPRIGQAINDGFPWLEAKCLRYKTPSCLDLAAISRSADTPRCISRGTGVLEELAPHRRLKCNLYYADVGIIFIRSLQNRPQSSPYYGPEQYVGIRRPLNRRWRTFFLVQTKGSASWLYALM